MGDEGRSGCLGSVSAVGVVLSGLAPASIARAGDEADPGSSGLQDGQHGRGPPEVEQSAAVGGNVLVVAGAEAEKVAQVIVSATEPGG